MAPLSTPQWKTQGIQLLYDVGIVVSVGLEVDALEMMRLVTGLKSRSKHYKEEKTWITDGKHQVDLTRKSEPRTVSQYFN